MQLNQCMRMVPFLGRRFAGPGPHGGVPLPIMLARNFFGRPRHSDIGALIYDMNRQMDRQMEMLERQMFRSMFPAARATALPIDNTLSPQEGGGQYRVSVDLAGFKPEEINLSLDEAGRRLTISAKCERRGSDGSRFAQEVTRSVSLPESIDVEKLQSTLHQDGVLAIEAPFKEEVEQQQRQEPQSIPISRTGRSLEQGQDAPKAVQDKSSEVD